MPVIVTKNVGPVVEIIKMHKLGLVIEPTKEHFLEAANEIYKNQIQFRNNIAKYLSTSQGQKITDFFEI